MSEGLIVRPGDILVLPVAPPSRLDTRSRREMKEMVERDLPGVTVIVAEGIAGGAFVYRSGAPSGGPTGGTPE